MSTNFTTRPPEDWLPRKPNASASADDRRLWFQVAASAFAWLALGLGDMLITWQACVHEEQYGGASVHPKARILYFAVTLLLFCLAVLVGTMSYRTWRKLTNVTGLLSAEGRERSEFMSLAGVFISFTLGAGIVWLCLPLFLIQMCLRTR